MRRKIRFTAVYLFIAVLCVISPMAEMTAFADEGGDTEYIETEAEKSKEAKVSGMYQAGSGRTLANPRIMKDSSMRAGQKVTWDCVYFGSYPQSEVESSDPAYKTLQAASGWCGNDIAINGKYYRRMKKGDAVFSGSGSAFYDWPDSDTYHYFKYEPIKWRVLKVEGNRALLLSDIVLDNQKYNSECKNATWETSTIRSWLNGYGASSNQQGIDYSKKSFIGSAFTPDEQSAVQNTSVTNTDNMRYGTTGGNHTTDKIFLLSESEVFGDSTASYGFVSGDTIGDEARLCKSSTYAKAMGVWNNTDGFYKGNCDWWLRSPGEKSDYAVFVSAYGNGSYNGHSVCYSNDGIRAALNLNLSSLQWTSAGVSGSKEGDLFFRVKYDGNGGSGVPSSQIKRLKVTLTLAKKKPVRSGYTFIGWSKNKKASSAAYKAGGKFTGDRNTVLYAVWKRKQTIKTPVSAYKKAFGAKAFSIGAKASGGGKLTYFSSNKKAASVSKTGKVTIKGCGTAKITIKAAAAGNYLPAVKKITVKVVPKRMTLKSVKSTGKKKLTFSWKKDKDVTGYQIYVSLRKDFKRETIKRNYKKSVSSKTIIGWRSKRVYYVKIRAYKKIGSTWYYGAWSKVRRVKVK